MAHKLPFLSKPTELHKFNIDMQQNSPFVVTKMQFRSDLGMCVIGTVAPHFVAKVRGFKFSSSSAIINEHERGRQIQYFENTFKAFQNALAAHEASISVKEYIERKGMTYDEEKDESRLILKVPGLNVYLELFGCLDDCEEPPQTECIAVLSQMSQWYRSVLKKSECRKYASRREDYQPRADWKEDYNENEFFHKQDFRGIGFDYVDQSRREDNE